MSKNENRVMRVPNSAVFGQENVQNMFYGRDPHEGIHHHTQRLHGNLVVKFRFFLNSNSFDQNPECGDEQG